MLNIIFKTKRLDDPDQLTKSEFFAISACIHFMLWKKSFNQDQIYYLLNFIHQNSSCKHIDDAAHLITRIMADLHKSGSVMDFLYNSKFIASLDKKYKKHSIEQILIFVLLGGEEYMDKLNYVGYFHTDVNLGGDFAFTMLIRKAYKKCADLRDSVVDKSYFEAVEIIDDALSRTDYINNGR